MALKIRTTGLEQYAPGGNAVLKMMIIGGPSAGKSRMSSFWPKPIYADCEGGLASVADRKVPFVTVNSSQDMLDFLAYMKMECRRPYADREFQTVVIDTLDAFHRKIKDEWLLANPGAQAFRGFDAWGYLETKMQMLLTRLLNLNCNVIVTAHYKDKTIREGTGENASERQEFMLQLQGDVKDSVYNDFDLVGWLGTYWAVEDGVRVEKRGLTFKKTPDKPFLKDRLFITPPWMEIKFSDEDYATLFGAFTARLDELGESEDLGEIPSEIPTTVRPPTAGTGPLPPMDPADMPLSQLSKPVLQDRARELGVKFKGNDLKSELVAMIEAKLAEIAEATPASPPDGDATNELATEAIDAAVTDSDQPVEVAMPEPVDERQAVMDRLEAAQSGHGVAVAPVDVSHLLELDPSMDEAVADVVGALGGEVISDTVHADGPTMTPGPDLPALVVPVNAVEVCRRCGTDLAREMYANLSKVKYRVALCDNDFSEARDAIKAGHPVPWLVELQAANRVSA